MPLFEGFLELLARLFSVYLVISLGILWRFSRFFRPEYGKWFTTITIWVFFPVSIISSFAKVTTFSGSIFVQVAIVTIVVHVASYISSRILLRNYPKEEIGAHVLCASFPNAMFFPFPIILAVAGVPALLYAAIFAFMALLLRNSLGAMIGIWHRPETTHHIEDNQESALEINLKHFALDMLKFPPFMALIIGFFIYWFYGPQSIAAIPGLEISRNIAIYGSLILVGVSFKELSQLHPKRVFAKKTFQMAFTRFFIAPSLAVILLMSWEVPAIIAIPLLIQSMAPPAVSIIIYGKFFQFSEADVSLLITSLTLLALIALPFELYTFLVFFPLS